MRSKFAALAAVAAFMLVALAASAAAKPNFSGTWALDATKSECGQRGCNAETMTVKQDGDKLTVERKTTGPQGGENTSTDTYTADGKEGDFTMNMMRNEVKGKRTSKWSADGKALEVHDKASLDTPNGAMTIDSTSTWTLSDDGKTLTIEGTRTTPRGDQKFKRVFNKQ